MNARGPSIRLIVATLIWSSGSALAQQGQRPAESLLLEQRRIDEQLSDQRRQFAPVSARLDWQWGGWIDYYFFDFNDGIQSQRLVQRPSLYIWSRLSADDGAHEVFVRGRLRLDYYEPGDQYERQRDWVGPNLDRGWYQMDIGKALNLTRPSDPVQAKVRAGRQQVTFGTGYALNLPLDAVVLDSKIWDFAVTGLMGKTIGSYPNIDRSEPVDTHSARQFYGVQAKYTRWQHHEPFAYAIWNNDSTDERPRDFYQNYSYDTQYFGFGSRGELGHPWRYWTEATFEQGRGYNDGDFLRRNYVEAWGWDVGIEHLWDCPHRSRVFAEYMFGSGDGGRVFSPTNARGGNYGDRRDTSFSAFGYRDTGIAAGLLPSNLHIWRLGGSLKPLPMFEQTRDLEVGTNWSLFHKNAARGAISDQTAQEFEGYVGWEMDYYFNWRFSSDVSWTTRWGLFFPGSAYQDQSARSFLLTGLTWSF